MSIYAIHTIKGKAPVVKMFNEYLRALRTPDLAAAPRYSMKRFWKEVSRANDAELDDSMGMLAFNHYHLRTLNASLHDLTKALKEAESTLKSFLKGGQTLTEWATANRLTLVQQYGGEEDDWYNTGQEDAKGEEVWAVTPATPENLRHYDLWSELGLFFTSGGSHGEYIGSSGPEHYKASSCIVEQQSVFSFRKMIEVITGKPCNIVSVNEEGQETPVSLGQMIEDELNEDLRGMDLVGRFNGCLAACVQARAFYKKMNRHEPDEYRELLRQVQNIRQLNTAPF